MRIVDFRLAHTYCQDQVTLALDRDRRIYEAKMTMFQDCADAIDKTLQKAGTELYPYAKEFGVFFAGCLSEWLGTQRPSLQTTGTPRPKSTETLTYARRKYAILSLPFRIPTFLCDLKNPHPCSDIRPCSSVRRIPGTRAAYDCASRRDSFRLPMYPLMTFPIPFVVLRGNISGGN